MQHETFADYMADHLSNRQRPPNIPDHIVDQVEAAALDGANTVDAVARRGQESGAIVTRSPGSLGVFNRLAERFTQSFICMHLVERPIQPRYMHGAVPERVFCIECLMAFLVDEGIEIQHHDASSACDACGSETKSEDLHVGNMSNGLDTYVVQVCDTCFNTGSRQTSCAT